MKNFIFITMFILPAVLAVKAKPMAGQKKIGSCFIPVFFYPGTAAI